MIIIGLVRDRLNLDFIQLSYDLNLSESNILILLLECKKKHTDKNDRCIGTVLPDFRNPFCAHIVK